MIDETYDHYQMAEIDAATWEQAQDGETVAVEIDDTDAPF